MGNKKETTTKKKADNIMTMTYATLESEFHPSLIGLGNAKIPSIPVIMNIAKTRKNVVDAYELFIEMRKDAIEAHCVMKEDGKPAVKGGNKYVYETPAIEKQVNERVQELSEKEVDIEVFYITAEDIEEAVGINANIIVGLGEYLKE